jgi:hypothetical protein
MNEPKRRGRPPKALSKESIEARVATISNPPDFGKIAAQVAPGTVPVINGHGALSAAQAYALRVWAGQSISEPLEWRRARVKEALEGQNLPTEGVVLP